jgi:hypothetical protein
MSIYAHHHIGILSSGNKTLMLKKYAHKNNENERVASVN